MRVISELQHTPKGHETHCRRIVAECQQQRRDLSRQADPRRHPALMTLGKTSFCDIAAHQKDDLFADAIGGAVPSEPTFRQRLAYLAVIPDARNWMTKSAVRSKAADGRAVPAIRDGHVVDEPSRGRGHGRPALSRPRHVRAVPQRAQDGHGRRAASERGLRNELAHPLPFDARVQCPQTNRSARAPGRGGGRHEAAGANPAAHGHPDADVRCGH